MIMSQLVNILFHSATFMGLSMTKSMAEFVAEFMAALGAASVAISVAVLQISQFN